MVQWDIQKTIVCWFSIEATASIIVLLVVLYRKYNHDCTLYEKIIQNLCIADVGLEFSFLIEDLKYLLQNKVAPLWIDMILESILNFFIFFSLIWVIIISYTAYKCLVDPDFEIKKMYKQFMIWNIITSILASAYALFFETRFYMYHSRADFKVLDYSDAIVLLLIFISLTYYYIFSLIHLRKIGFDLQPFFKQLLIYPTILIICWFPIPIIETLVVNNIINFKSDTFLYLTTVSESLSQLIGLLDALAYGWRKNQKHQTLASSQAINIEINESLD